MGLKIFFLLILSAALTFAQNNNYRRIEQQTVVENLSNENIFPINRVSANSGVWTELNPKLPRTNYWGVYFVNNDTGIATGEKGAIIKTTDGGISWYNIETNYSKTIRTIGS
jgi:hypothetical protein